MAKKSKTQRAKASARRQARAEEARQAEAREVEVVEEEAAETGKLGSLLSKTPFKSKKNTESDEDRRARELHEKQVAEREAKEKEKEKKEKKKNRFRFFKECASEMKRVTWPSRTDVIRWSGVVVVALIFFGAFVLVLDNLVVTPLLYLISGLG